MRRLVPHLTIACVAAGALALELVQTRILSALYYNHVVYLTVTVALLGFGAAGVALSLLARDGRDERRWLAGALAAFAWTAPLCPALASRAPAVLSGLGSFHQLAVCYLLLTVPFLCAGFAIGLLLRRHAARVFSLYAADLAASAGGTLGFALLLRPLGADRLLWAIAGLGALAMLLETVDAGRQRALALATAAVLLVAAPAVDDRLLGRQPSDYKMTARVHGGELRVEQQEWTPLAKIEVLAQRGRELDAPWAMRYPGTRYITQDGSAHTVLLPPQLARHMATHGIPLPGGDALGYVVRPRPRRVLVIGVGGGKDMVIARAFGAREIVGVELNPATVDLMRGRYRARALWPDWPGVTLHRAEGRQYLRRTAERFDVIVLSGVDTFAALSSGAYVLSENYLYTVEGIGDMLDALAPGGVLVIYRWLFAQPRETLRLANLFLAAAERRGMPRPAESILVIADDQGWLLWGVTLMKREPFRPPELRAVLERVAVHPRQQLVHPPPVLPAPELARWHAAKARAGEPPAYLDTVRPPFAHLLAARDAAARQRFERSYPYDVSPVPDDRPFFFEYEKLPPLGTLLRAQLDELRGAAVYSSLLLLLAATIAAAVLGTVVPLSLFARDGLRVPRRGWLVAFFASLGIGFMLLEIALMQRLSLFLGDPVHALTVVLAGLLLFSGAGSLLAGRWRAPRRALLTACLAVFALVAVALALLPAALAAAFHWPLSARVAVTAAGLLPLGLALGVPFPTGLRHVERLAPRFLPWAWGINGLASVAGSVLAVALAMRIGFSLVLLLGGVTYLVAALAAWRLLAAAPAGLTARG